MTTHRTLYNKAFAGALVVLMLMTSMAMAMGQMRSAAVGEMVLCTGHGAEIVLIDAQGQPTKAKTQCPECLAAQMLLQAAAPTVTIPAEHSFTAVASVAQVETKAQNRAEGNGARAPPLA